LSLFHLDADYLVYATCQRGLERERVTELLDSEHELQISSAAWYEFCRGPRLPDEIAVARCLFAEDGGVIPLSEDLAVRAADVFRSLGSPRRRALDVVIGVTAVSCGACLLTRNRRDFESLPGLLLDTD
jgi:predicted nucleic acid-binding protein